MERISVDLGQFALTGEPVAVMGSGPQIACSPVFGLTQSVLYIEFQRWNFSRLVTKVGAN
jgi:murein hydrolase activator